ncbi:proclotting enzyme isoform X2 [Drosophila pseudoobscura]|uniref:Proclotting enzyme isoform X2 n=2 Tax=Drosophila pseudoobscura pseudoobscura TaxID=46245 RepID=A0A6I8V2J3_DROPS|nr:proclotting enzyme isoform X2 [Drosophila pseudoobscura]
MGLKLAIIVSLIALARCQLLPENACSDYFQYVNDGFEGLQGEVTLPSVMRGRNRIDVRLTQRGDQDPSSVGTLRPYPDEEAARSTGGTAKFRISLRPDPSTGLLPKLSRLSYNDLLLCSATEYGPPNSFFNRFYEIHVSVQSHRPLRPLDPSSVFGLFPREQSGLEVNTLFYGTPTQTSFPSWTSVSSGGAVSPDWPQTWQTQAPAPAPARAPPQRPRATPAPPATTVFWQPPVPPQVTTTARAPSPTRAPNRFNPQPASTPVECGREGRLSPFIHRGKEFPRGQYPWLSAIYHKESLSLAFKCGGSLISASMVITAAHCVYKMQEDRVLIGVGRYDLDDYNEDGAEMHDVRRLLWHPEFSTRVVSDADIALVTMQRPVTFNDIIGPICLWTEKESETVTKSGFIAGWGTDEFGNSKTQYPRVVEAEIASATDCISTWKASAVTERTLCAGNRDGSGPCLGDSGGGLMIRRDTHWVLRGIVSLGERGTSGRCQLSQYVLYCDLSKHLTWINENLS